jgi:hypothetical protein
VREQEKRRNKKRGKGATKNPRERTTSYKTFGLVAPDVLVT